MKIETLSQICLHPVIRLSPSDFDEVIYPFKTRVSKARQDEYWKEVLTKHGLPNLDPFAPGLHYVKTSAFDEASLEILIKHGLVDISAYRCSPDPEIEKDPLKDEITPTSFEGGVIMTSEDKIKVSPQCCVSLQDHIEWGKIQQREEFGRIWLGHPWMYYKTKGEDVLFTRLIEKAFDGLTWKHYTLADNSTMMDASQCIEKKTKEINDEDLMYSVNFIEMKDAIAGLQKELNIFQARIEKILMRLKVVNPKKLADCLVNGNGELLSYDSSLVE